MISEARRQANRCWRKNNAERVASYSREYKKNNPDKVKEWQKTYHQRLKARGLSALHGQKSKLSRYGLTLDQYDEIWIEQLGQCAICRTSKPGGFGKEFAVDHDHTTGKVRGLLCHSCNTALGHFKDSPTILSAAIFYINNYVFTS